MLSFILDAQCPNWKTIMPLTKQFSMLTLGPQMQPTQELEQLKLRGIL
jgi:hypothetical protein